MVSCLSLIATVGGTVVYAMRGEVSQNPELKELGRFYREWEVISRYGSVGFFFYILGNYVRYTIGVIVFFAVAGPWLLASAMVGFVGAYPLLITNEIAHGFYWFASRSGHWLCLCVTMAVTVLSWFIYHDSFADPRVLWIVALGTGIVSGGATEVARRVLLAFYAKTAIGRLLANKEAADELVVGGDDDRGYLGFMLFKFGSLWFRQNRLARMFRAVCFGTPVG